MKLNRFSAPRPLSTTSGLLLTLLLIGCTTNVPAPVVDRSAERAVPRSQPLPPTTASPIVTETAPAVTTRAAPPSQIVERSAPPATALPPSATQAGNTPGSAFHVVQRGETLYRIAVNNGVSVDQLAAWNGLNAAAPNIREGQVIRLRPPEGALAQTAPMGTPDLRAAPPATNGLMPPPTSGLTPPPTSGSAPMIVPPSVATVSEPRAQRVPYTDGALAQMQRGDAARGAAPGATNTNSASPGVAGATPGVPNSGRQPIFPANPGDNGATSEPATTPPVTATEAEVKPGNGVERDGVAWTWPTSGRVASRWNERAAMKGIDISAKGGTPVVAAAAGKVIYVGKEPRGYGQMIVVSHAKETVSVYFHTDKVTVKEQQRVTLGQRMAEVSDTSGNKIHFEVRKQGRPLDPITLMPSR